MITIVAFLLLGAAINVAVAWGCELWSPWTHRTSASPTDRGAIRDIGSLVPKDWLQPGEFAIHEDRIGVGLHVHLLYVVAAPTATPVPQPHGPHMLHVHRAGWPMASLECDTISDGWGVVFPRNPGDTAVWRGGVVVPRIVGGEIRKRAPEVPDPLPLRPVWTGFALDTLLYAAACWTIMGGPFTLRRWRRVRRGLCLKCGYPVRGLARCPECGREAGPAATGTAVEEKAGVP